VTPAVNGVLTLTVPPISAILLNPVLPAATNLLFSVTGNKMDFRWPSNYTGWLLQSNSTGLTLSNGWFTIPGSSFTNALQVTIERGKTNVFYRLISP
jgi:hypothetical protein